MQIDHQYHPFFLFHAGRCMVQKKNYVHQKRNKAFFSFFSGRCGRPPFSFTLMAAFWFLLVLPLLPHPDTKFTASAGSMAAADSRTEQEEFLLTFSHPGIGRVYVTALYDYRNDIVKLPFVELFDRLEIGYDLSGRNLITGIFLLGGDQYRINLAYQTIRLGGRVHSFDADDLTIGETDYFFTTEIFEKVFDMAFTVNMNALSLSLNTPHTMPVEERRRREQMRSRMAEHTFAREYYPIRYGRQHDIMRLGFLDYNLGISGVVDQGTPGFSYQGIGGIGIFGGDLQGSYTGRYTSSGGWTGDATNIRWRYGIRDQALISEIQAGQVGTRGLSGYRVTGITLSNDPIEPRQHHGTHIVEGSADPDSEVELYINNNLIDFTVADAMGYYRFEVPVRYGTTRLRTQIYSPDGGLQIRERELQVPFSFLPKGVASYNIQAGYTDSRADPLVSEQIAGHADIGYGITPWLTSRIGMDYLESDDGLPFLYGSASARFFGNYLVNADIAPGAFYRAQSSVIFAGMRSISLNYTHYDGTTRFNRQGAANQISGNIYSSVPFPLIDLGVRVGADRVSFSESSQTRFNSDFFTRISRVNLRFNYRSIIYSNNDATTRDGGQLRGAATYTLSRSRSMPVIFRGITFRLNATYDLEQEEFRQADFQLSRNLMRNGRFTFSALHIFPSSITSFQAGINLDLGGRMRSSTDYRTQQGQHAYRQNIRGSVGLDDRNRYFHLSDRTNVGRGAASVILFIDNNNSGTFDEGDEILPYPAVRLDRSSRISVGNDGILRLTQLHSYYRYNMEINRRAIPNPLLVPAVDKFSFISDPNQFKQIEIPFYRSGVIDGTVFIEKYEEKEGQGGLRLFLKGLDNDYRDVIRTFYGGGFYAMDIPPGKYSLEVDPAQMEFLNVNYKEERASFEVRALAEGDFVQDIEIVLLSDDPLTRDELIARREYLERYTVNLRDKLRLALNSFKKSQDAFYEGNFRQAMHHINQSLELFETDYGIALKGTITYVLGDFRGAVDLWNKANRRNPDIRIPDMGLLDMTIILPELAEEPEEEPPAIDIDLPEVESPVDIAEIIIPVEMKRLENLFSQMTNNVITLYIRAQNYLDDGRPDRALVEAERANSIQETAEVLLLKAEIYTERNNEARAEEFRKRAERLDPDQARIRIEEFDEETGP